MATLFTPHLFSYKDEHGCKLEADANNLMQVIETYADIYYLAALNAWELDGKGDAQSFPYTRGDFHEYAMGDPKHFAKDVDFAVQALTGKSLKDVAAEQAEEQTAEAGKKKRFRWITKLSKRS